MGTDDLIKKIQSRAYWRVEIRPTEYEQLRIPTFSKAREIIQSCKVQWRGRDYPHWNEEKVRNMSDWVELHDDWRIHIEHWRFYRSGQFIHLIAAHEDHSEPDTILTRRYPLRLGRDGYISFLSTTYQITEIFEFAARLAHKGILHPSVFISIGLHQIESHELASIIDNRSYDDDFIYTMKEPVVIEREIPKQQLISDSDDYALDFIIEIFQRFNRVNPSRQMLSEAQKRLRNAGYDTTLPGY